MSIRKHRRALIAELLLLADPSGIRIHADGESIAVDFDSIAELRSWLHLAGLDTPDLLASEPRENTIDGRVSRIMAAYPTWHGWDFYASASEYVDTAAPLTPEVTAALTALTVAA